MTALSPPSRSANQCLAWGGALQVLPGDPLISYAAAMFRARYSHPRAVKPVLGGARVDVLESSGYRLTSPSC